MLALHDRVPARLRVRLAIVGAALLLIGGTTGVLAVVFNQNGPFTGCLSTKAGVVYNVAQSATTPLQGCLKADKIITFSNAQGPQGIQGIQGVPGTNGTNGQNGAPGTNGTNGNSIRPSNQAYGTVGSDNCASGSGMAYDIVDGTGAFLSRSVVCDGAQGTKGDAGQPGPTGAPGAPGSTPIYIAARSIGTALIRETLASNVNGFDVTLACGANLNLDSASVSANWLGGDPNVVAITEYSSGLFTGGHALSSSVTGLQLQNRLGLAYVDNISAGTTVGMFSQGFVMANAAGIGSQQESGFEYSLYLQLRLNSAGTAGDCTVTGTLVPISGNRSIPLPFHLP